MGEGTRGAHAEEHGHTFVRIHDGRDRVEHHFHGRAIFRGALYIGGGSGKAGSGDGILYRITDREDTEPDHDRIGGVLPFGTVFVLTEFDGSLYAAGRWEDRVYSTQDGVNWDRAFSRSTSYSWQNGITFGNALYIVSCEGSGETRTTIVWRSTDGETLEKVKEIERTTTERPALGIFNGMLYMGVERIIDGEYVGYLYRSQDGESWDEIFTTTTGHRFQEFCTFNGSLYFTMSGVYCGGSLFRSHEGTEFELTARWDESVEYGDNGAYGLCVFENELYVTLNHDGGTKYVRLLKSDDGTTFSEVWSTTVKDMSAGRVCVYDGNLYLYLCGKMDRGEGSEIWYYRDGEFTRKFKGDPDRDHILLRNEKFRNALYISGGSGNWKSEDATVHRIGYGNPIFHEEEQNDFIPINVLITGIFLCITLILITLSFAQRSKMAHEKRVSEELSAIEVDGYKNLGIGESEYPGNGGPESHGHGGSVYSGNSGAEYPGIGSDDSPRPSSMDTTRSEDVPGTPSEPTFLPPGIQGEIVEILTPIRGMTRHEIATMLGRDENEIAIQLELLRMNRRIQVERIAMETVYSVIRNKNEGPMEQVGQYPPPPILSQEATYEYDDETDY